MPNNQASLLLRAAKRGAVIIGPSNVEVVHEPRMRNDRLPWRRKGSDVRYLSRECQALWPDGRTSDEKPVNQEVPRKSSRPRRLGFVQARALRNMQGAGRNVWYPSVGWAIGNISQTVRVMESLARKGLVEKVEPRKYRLMEAGRAWRLY